METVRPVINERKSGRPRGVPEDFEPEVIDLYKRGYGYCAIARIMNGRDHGINVHFSTIRKTLIRLGRVKDK